MGWGMKSDTQNVEIAPVEKEPLYNPQRASPKKQLDKIRRIEDKILADALKVIEGIGRGADYDDGEDRESVTAEEVALFGSIDAALRSKRIALDARRPEKDAPVYLKHQHNIAVSIMKARATEQAAKTGATAIQVNVFMGDAKPQGAIEAEFGGIDDIIEVEEAE